MTNATPHQLKCSANSSGEPMIIEAPYPFLPRDEVWITRIDWQEWRRLMATDDFIEAQYAWMQGLNQL